MATIKGTLGNHKWLDKYEREIISLFTNTWINKKDYDLKYLEEQLRELGVRCYIEDEFDDCLNYLADYGTIIKANHLIKANPVRVGYYERNFVFTA